MKKNNTIYYLAIGILKENQIKVLFDFQGTYKDTLNFLNKNIVIFIFYIIKFGTTIFVII